MLTIVAHALNKIVFRKTRRVFDSSLDVDLIMYMGVSWTPKEGAIAHDFCQPRVSSRRVQCVKIIKMSVARTSCVT